MIIFFVIYYVVQWMCNVKGVSYCYKPTENNHQPQIPPALPNFVLIIQHANSAIIKLVSGSSRLLFSVKRSDKPAVHFVSVLSRS